MISLHMGHCSFWSLRPGVKKVDVGAADAAACSGVFYEVCLTSGVYLFSFGVFELFFSHYSICAFIWYSVEFISILHIGHISDCNLIPGVRTSNGATSVSGTQTFSFCDLGGSESPRCTSEICYSHYYICIFIYFSVESISTLHMGHSNF